MSPDDIFAAQFWPWPDPAIKRDAQGRVLFVNAAFLALYGGQVENWRGNAVGGWPAPQAGGSAPYRFETRLPAADGSEQVYDWMEQTLADGNAFALARNVTVFTTAPEPDPAHAAMPEQPFTETSAQMAEPPMQAAAQAPAYGQAPAFEAEPAHAQAPAAEAPALPDTPAPMAAEETIPVPEIDIPSIEIPSDEAYALTETSEMPAEAEVPPAPTGRHERREFERRALPIEDDSAVLGNNWRDAVIAKAVGAEAVAPDGTTDMGTNIVDDEPALAPEAEKADPFAFCWPKTTPSTPC